MAEHGTSLAPDELDRLEDALERWTDESFEPGPEDSLLATHLRERLAGYRSVLATTRAALPLEDVGDDVLAGVLAEAHRDAAQPQRAVAGAKVGWWERLRRSMLLPGVALAGSAALLLWLVQPSEELTLGGGAADDALPAREEARLAPEPGPAPAAPVAPAEPKPEAEAPADAKAEAPGAMGDRPSAGAPALQEIELDDLGIRPKSKVTRKDEKPPAPEEKLPGLGGGAPPAAVDKEELRDTLERANKARNKGDCDAAMGSYREAMDMDGHPTERAQVLAGYGLCLQQRGEDGKATKYFESARKLWPGIDGWIGRESGEGKKPMKTKPAPKSSDLLPDVLGK